MARLLLEAAVGYGPVFPERAKASRLKPPNHLMKAVRLPSSQAVRAVIVASLRQGDATVDSTARKLQISARTLQRHLGRMGTSHSEMLAEARLNIACRLLEGSSQRLSDIAKTLGYSNASSFSRTFVRLMKVQPVIYRKQQLARKDRSARN